QGRRGVGRVGESVTGNPPFPPTRKPLPEGARATRELLRYLPQLSLAERNRRWDRTRKKMLMAGDEALLLMGNDSYWGMGMADVRYILQIDGEIGAVGLFPLTGEPVVWHAPVHMSRPTNMLLSTQEWTEDIRPIAGWAVVADEMRRRGMARS